MTRLLLVEDDEDSVELIKTALEMGRMNINLHVCYDGEEAWKYLDEGSRAVPPSLPELLILDLNLPKKNGRELLADMRTSNVLRELPVVMLTTTEWHDDLKKEYPALKLQCYSKPMRFQEYMEMLKKIHERFLQRELRGVGEK